MAIYIFFTDHGKKIYAPFLKHGFRHCFCIYSNNDASYIVEKTQKGLVLKSFPLRFEKRLIAYFCRQNMTLITLSDTNFTNFDPNITEVSMGFTCVDAVKRVLSLHAPFVLTPYQLYRLLT